MRRAVVGTAGHIDHGKSALVKRLTGTDPDRLPEEKARGITIDLGFAHTVVEEVALAFVDVPGHERFVRTMVAGTSGIDIALLVVASDDSVMPQTREHLAILKLLDVGARPAAGVIARSKCDLVDGETGRLVEEEIQELVAGSFLEGAPTVAVSAVTGEGIGELKLALAAVARALPPRSVARGIPRLFVDRAFPMKGFGPVVTGTLDGGSISVEDRLLLLPQEREVRVRRIEVHGEERQSADAGERTSLNLAGCEMGDLSRGQTLVLPNTLKPSAIWTVELCLLPTIAKPLVDGARVRVHLGTAEAGAKLVLLDEPGPEGRRLAPGATAMARLHLERALPVLRTDRFIARRPSPVETLGGGRVLETTGDLLAPGRGRSVPAGVERVLRTGSDRDVAELFLRNVGAAGLEATHLAWRLGQSPALSGALLDALVKEGAALRLNGPQGLAVSSESALEMTRRADETLVAWRKGGAPSPFVPKREFLERFAPRLSTTVAESWLSFLATASRLTVDGDRVGPKGARSGDVVDSSSGFVGEVARRYKEAGFDPPKAFDIAKHLGTKPPVVEGLATHLLKTGELVRLSPDLVVHRATLEAVLGKLAPLKGQTLSVGGFRDLLGLSRKTLIPLLEYLDQKRRTRRVGDARVVE